MNDERDRDQSMLLGMLALPEEQVVVINYLLSVPTATYKQVQLAVTKTQEKTPWADTTLDAVLDELAQTGYIEKLVENEEPYYRVNLGRAHFRPRKEEPSTWDSLDWDDL